MTQVIQPYRECYLGYQIDGYFVQGGDGQFVWRFKVMWEDQVVFTLETVIPWSAFDVKGLEREEAIDEVRREGLRRVKGRLSLGWFEEGGNYQHTILKDEERVSPPLPKEQLPFASDKERVTYYLLQSLYRIRTEYPDLFKSVEFDWEGVCTVAQAPVKVGLMVLGMLGEGRLISGLRWRYTHRVGSSEPYGSIYINTYGIGYYEALERTILERAQEVMMPDVIGKAVLILRCLVEVGAIGGKGMVGSGELRELSGLSEEDYDQADEFLRGQKYVNGILRPTGKRWVTPVGIEFLEEQMSRRMRLSLSAEKIARFLFTKREHEYEASISQLQQALGLNEGNCQEAARELIDENLAKDAFPADQIISRFMEIALTAEGRRAVRNNFVRELASTFQQNVGAVIYGPVSDSNVLAVAQAHQSRVQQVIEGGDAAALRDEIGQLLEQAVEAVKGELTVDQLAVYAGAAKDLRSEANKDKPDSPVIQKCLNALNFADNLDGTIELGKKTMELALKVGPLMMLLQQATVRLLEMLG